MPPKKSNRWVNHVKQYRSEHHGTYKDSLRAARPSYKTQQGQGLWDDAIGFLKKHKVLSTVGRALTPLVSNPLLKGLADRGVGYIEQQGFGPHAPTSHGRVKF
jgi:hypothetical protein